MAESSNATTYVPVPDTVDPLESSEVTVMFITAALVSLILANATSTCIHRCGHDSKTGRSRNWVQSFPESMIVLTYGLIVGLVLLLIVTLATDKSSEEVISEQLLSAAIFQADTFNLVLLPIIIFTSGFTLKPKSLFFNLIFPILVLAILGTLICAAIIGGGVYVLMTVLPAMPLYTVSIYTAMTYGSLLAAIDPVATLSIFVNLKVSVLSQSCGHPGICPTQVDVAVSACNGHLVPQRVHCNVGRPSAQHAAVRRVCHQRCCLNRAV